MDLIYRKKTRLIALLLALSLLLSSCIANRSPKTDTTQSSETSQEYEHYQEDTLKVQSDFDQLTDQLFRESITDGLSLHYTLHDPAAYGITDVPMTLGTYSVEEMKRDLEDNKKLYVQLETIDTAKLTKDQLLTYKIMKSVLHASMGSEGMELYDLPFTTTIGIQAQLPILLAEYTLETKQDVEDYLSILSSIDTYYAQIMEYMKAKADAGLMLSDTSIDHIVESCDGYLIPASHSFMNTTFQERLEGVSELTAEEKSAYIQQNLALIEEHFLPAYQAVKDGMTALKGTGTTDGGLCNLPGGKEYYKYLVESGIHPSYSSIDELKTAIQKRMDEDLSAQTAILNKDPDIINRIDSYAFTYTEPEDILANLQEEIKDSYPELPDCSYTLKHVPTILQNTLSPAFYLTPQIDDFKNNVIYVNDKYSNTDIYTTLAHESYPGHLFQNVYFANKQACSLRYIMNFPSYSEGWGTYAEIHSYLFNNGLDDNIAKVLAYKTSHFLGLHAVMDINIHYYGWTKEQFKEYLEKHYGFSDDEMITTMYYSIVETPSNYLKYFVGFMEFSDMANIASQKMGSTFNLKAYNTFLLDIGPAPFDVIRDEFEYWLLTQ